MAERRRKKLNFPNYLHAAIAKIRQHPRCASEVTARPVKGGWELLVDWQVSLSYRGAAKGESRKGVRSIEPVTLIFGKGYPSSAPIPRLRPDFPRDFPHIQPRSDRVVEPCLVDEPLDEAFVREGMDGFLHRLSHWLDGAGRDTLMNLAQGWEPTRRDNLRDTIISGATQLRCEDRDPAAFGFRFCIYEELGSKIEGSTESAVRLSRSGKNAFEASGLQVNFDDSTGEEEVGVTILAFVRSPNTQTRYFNRNIGSVQDVISELEQLELGQALRGFLAMLAAAYPKARRLPVGLVVAVQRPAVLVGTTSDIELIPYILRLSADKVIAGELDFTAAPARVAEAVSPELLARFSGLSLQEERQLKLIGAGSLGSKVAVHEARRGSPPSLIVDNKLFVEHNSARHVLVPHRDVSEGIDKYLAFIGRPAKASALSALVSRFGVAEPDFSTGDIVDILSDRTKRERYFASGDSLTLVTTGSRRVRSAFVRASASGLGTRVIEAFATAGGKVGGILMEGKRHQPDLGELFCLWMLRLDSDPLWSGWIESGHGRRVSTGQGCGSSTVAASDASLSLIASSIAESLIPLRRAATLTEKGTFNYGRREGLSLNWEIGEVAPFRRVRGEPFASWSVSISHRAERSILADCEYWRGVETGGYLVGHHAVAEKRLIIVDQIPGPEGSVRARDRFSLAPLPPGSPYPKAGGFFELVGTWHKHLGDTRPSETDRQSAREIAQVEPKPRCLLITNSTSWSALITKD